MFRRAAVIAMIHLILIAQAWQSRPDTDSKLKTAYVEAQIKRMKKERKQIN